MRVDNLLQFINQVTIEVDELEHQNVNIRTGTNCGKHKSTYSISSSNSSSEDGYDQQPEKQPQKYVILARRGNRWVHLAENDT